MFHIILIFSFTIMIINCLTEYDKFMSIVIWFLTGHILVDHMCIVLGLCSYSKHAYRYPIVLNAESWPTKKQWFHPFPQQTITLWQSVETGGKPKSVNSTSKF